MSDALRPVNKGDHYLARLRNTETLNGMLDAARLARGQTGAKTGGTSGRGTVSPHSTVHIKVHKDMSLGSVVSVGGVVAWNPADDKYSAAKRPGFLSADPVSGSPFLVTLESATEDDIVPAVVSGLALVRLSTPNGVVHDFADVIDGDTTKMLSVATGPAAVLWSEEEPEDEEERWASVLIGSAAEAAVSAQVTELLLVDPDGTSGSGEPSPDPCGRVIAVLLSGDPCGLAAGTEIVVAPLSGSLYTDRRYRVWPSGTTVEVEEAGGSGVSGSPNDDLTGSIPSGTYPLYMAEGETRLEVVVHTESACVGGDIVTTNVTQFIYTRGDVEDA
jgi:hypothetical protein